MTRSNLINVPVKVTESYALEVDIEHENNIVHCVFRHYVQKSQINLSFKHGFDCRSSPANAAISTSS